MKSPINNYDNNNNSNNKDNYNASKNVLSEKEASEQSLLLWETYGRSSRLGDSSKNRRDKLFVIRVFCGGLTGNQSSAFKVAMSSILREYHENFMNLNPGLIRIHVEYITNSDVSDRKWLPSHLVDYLLESDLHFILTHVHQGLTSKNIGWIIPSLLKHLHRLKHHPGFPTGDQLSCPVFTQDKIKYIKYLGDFAIPTFEIRIPIPGYKHRDEELKTLRDWCDAHVNDSAGWIVKAPFTTNSHYIRFCHFIEEVLQCLNSASEDLTVGFCQIPYLMVQPCLYNRREYKVVCIKGDPYYIAKIGCDTLKCSNGINKAFIDKKNPAELFEFCKQALAEYKTRCPYSITDGLFRIDVLQMRSGKFVVNEFESLEATYYDSSASGNKEFKVRSFIEEYWDREIRSIMRKSFDILSADRYQRRNNNNNEVINAINCTSVVVDNG